MIKSEHFNGIPERKMQWLLLWHIGDCEDNICDTDIKFLFDIKMTMGYLFKADVSTEFLYITMIGC